MLASNSILFKPISKYIQWFYDKMIPNKHFVLLQNDLSDLLPKIKWFNKNTAKALEIIKNANELVQEYLTEQVIHNTTRDILIDYAKLQRLNLTEQEKKDYIENKKPLNTILK